MKLIILISILTSTFIFAEDKKKEEDLTKIVPRTKYQKAAIQIKIREEEEENEKNGVQKKETKKKESFLGNVMNSIKSKPSPTPSASPTTPASF